MADLIRRILWLIPVLVAGAVVVFFAFGSTKAAQKALQLPLFYNSNPQSAQVAAEDALDLALRGDPRGPQKLTVLGGAALPLVLEQLPSLSIQEQRTVTRALAGLADRMQVRESSPLSAMPWTRGSRTETKDSDAALLFWERYRDEHALDLQPLPASRLVKRAAQRDTRVKSTDLLAVDTYALPALVGALGRTSNDDDVARARRLVAAIAHVTGEPWVVHDSATVDDTRKVATEIRRYFDEHGAKWTQLGRFELLVAHLSQTEFSNWIFRTARQSSGLDDPELWERITKKGRLTFPIGAFFLLGLLILGPALAATIQVLQLRTSRWQLERLGLRAGLAAGVVSLLPILAGPQASRMGFLSILSVAFGTTISAFMLQRELGDRLDWRTHHVLRNRPGLKKVGAVARWLAPSVPTLTPVAVTEAVVWVTCLEVSSRTDGLGAAALGALRQGDLDYLMAFCLGLGLATGVAQILADLLLGSGRPSRTVV